jgi:hypothetical protein
MRFLRYVVAVFCGGLVSNNVLAQIGGKAAFDFLQLPTHARVAAEGGTNVSLVDSDVNMYLSNPAALNAEMHQHLAINYATYYADVKNTNLAYAHESKKLKGVLGFGFQNVNYGKFDGYDAGGNATNSFSAADNAFSVGYAQQQGVFTLAGSLKFANSRIDQYNANALLLDVGAVFNHPKRDFNVGLTVRNAGFLLNNYDLSQADKPKMPLNVQLGASYKLEHMPLRFSLTAHNLQTPDIVYLDPSKSSRIDENGNPIQEKKTLGDKMLRHLTAGGEFLLGKNFNLRFGYNHLVRREMRLEAKRGTAGFSWGFMFRVKNIEVAYSRAALHIAGGTGFLTVSANLGRWFKKKESSTNDGGGDVPISTPREASPAN